MTTKFIPGMWVKPKWETQKSAYQVNWVDLDGEHYGLKGLLGSYHYSDLELAESNQPEAGHSPTDDSPASPAHYNNNTDVLDFIESQNMSFSQGNIIKYAARYKKKGGKSDLLKVIHYAQLIIAKEYPEPADRKTINCIDEKTGIITEVKV